MDRETGWSSIGRRGGNLARKERGGRATKRNALEGFGDGNREGWGVRGWLAGREEAGACNWVVEGRRRGVRMADMAVGEDQGGKRRGKVEGEGEIRFAKGIWGRKVKGR